MFGRHFPLQVLFSFSFGDTGRKLPLCFVVPDKVFCSPFKSVHSKASKSKCKRPGRGGCLCGLHSSLINRLFLLGLQGICPTSTPFGPFGLLKTMSVVKMATEWVKLSSCINANLTLDSQFISALFSLHWQRTLCCSFWNHHLLPPPQSSSTAEYRRD